MSGQISETDKASFAEIIDSILATSDLTTISAKRIRQSLQERVGKDLVDQKNALNDFIKERFDKFTEDKQAKTLDKSTQGPATNGTASHVASSQPTAASSRASPTKHEPSSDLSELESDAPPKKKVKKSISKNGDDDAAYAARLQAEMNNAARPTRGGGRQAASKPIIKKKTPKKKSSTKITAEDDSDLEAASDGEKKSERGGAFNACKPMYLSQPLQDLLGEEKLSRPKTVKGIWNHVKANNLQNPGDKRQILCDEPLRAVFKKDSVHMFTMNKLLSSHLTPIED